jgi:hypothetical protein
MGITVVDVCRAMRVEPDKHLMWSVGNAMSRSWHKEHGDWPPSALRSKTNGGGSHRFAVYPEGRRAQIELLIRAHQPKPVLQLDLFEDAL